MINFSYRDHSVLHAAHALVASGQLGRIMHFEAHYLQSWLSSRIWGDWRTTPTWLWRLSSRHGSGGALVDTGVHMVDLATYVAGEDIRTVNARLKTFPKAKGNRIGEYVLDANDSAYLRVELKCGSLGSINITRWATGQENSLTLALYGETGALKIDLDASGRQMQVCLGSDVDKARWKTRNCRSTPSMYRRFIKGIQTGVNDASDFRRAWTVQKCLDACLTSDAQQKTITLR